MLSQELTQALIRKQFLPVGDGEGGAWHSLISPQRGTPGVLWSLARRLAVLWWLCTFFRLVPDLFMGKCASDATDQIPPRQHLRTFIYLWILFVLTVGSISTCWLFSLLLALSLASLLLGQWYFLRDTFVFKTRLRMTKIARYSP